MKMVLHFSEERHNFYRLSPS